MRDENNRANSLLVEIEEALMNASISTGAEREQSFDRAKKLVAELLAVVPNEADSNYAAGLTMYEYGLEQKEDGSLAESYFLKALSLDPTHQFARLYLGHYYYDNDKHAKALSLFEEVEEEYFLSIGQKWRVLKLHELILCCKLYLNSESVREEHFLSLADEFLTTDPEEVPVPAELITALVKTGGNPIWDKVNRSKVIRLIRETCKKLGFKQAVQEL